MWFSLESRITNITFGRCTARDILYCGNTPYVPLVEIENILSPNFKPAPNQAKLCLRFTLVLRQRDTGSMGAELSETCPGPLRETRPCSEISTGYQECRHSQTVASDVKKHKNT